MSVSGEQTVVYLERRSETPEIGAPRPEEVVVWIARVLGEIGRLPFTIYRVRKAIESLSRLPTQIEELIAALNRTTSVLEQSLPRVENQLDNLGSTFVGVDGRIEDLQGSVTTLTSTITNLVGAIPGARRTLRRND